MATRRFKKIIDLAAERSGWKNTQTFESDCNCVLEALVAELSIEQIVRAVRNQGFGAPEEYGRAATVLREIALERRPQRAESREPVSE